MRIDRKRLDDLVYEMSLQTMKVNQVDESHLPLLDEQKQKTHDACVNLIEELLVIIHDLESQH